MAHLLEGVDRKLACVIVFLCVPLLFLPKLNLISFESETAGLRLDDFLLLGAAALLLFARLVSNRPLVALETVFLLFFFATLISGLLGWVFYLNGDISSSPRLVYTLRNLEYFVFFYAGLLCFRFFDPLRVVAVWFALNVVVMLLQWGNILGGFSVYGYVSAGSLDGPPGITNGHWEISFILGICYVVLASSTSFSNRWLNLFYQVCLFSMMLFLMVITTSRSGVLGLLAAAVFLLMRSWSLSRRLLTLVFCGAIGVVALSVMAQSDAFPELAIARRSAGLLSWKNLEIVGKIYERADTESMSFDDSFSDVGMRDKKVDLSWQIRAHKWLYVIKYYLSRPACYLFGLGPGFCATALDGGLLRLFVEYGLVGGGLFLLLLRTMGKRGACLAGCAIVLLVHMVFIDMQLAYKAMSIFYFVVGAYSVAIVSQVNRRTGREDFFANGRNKT